MNILRLLIQIFAVSCTLFVLGCAEIKTRAGMPKTQEASQHYGLGTQYINFGEYEKAVVELGKAASLEPTSASVQLNLGASLLHTGQYNLAVNALRESDRLRPNYFPSLYELGQAFYAVGKYKESARHYEKAWHLDGFNPSYVPFILSVLSYRFAGEYTQADQMLREAKASLGIVGRYGVVIAKYLRGDIDRETMLKKGPKDKLNRLWPILFSGMDAAEKKDISLAEKDLKSVLQLSDPRWDPNFLAKVTLGKLGTK